MATSLGTPPPAGIAAIDAFLADYELGERLHGLGPVERRAVRDALVAFIVGEQWLATAADHGPLLAEIQAHAERALLRGAADTVALLAAVARLVEELATRLALQRHAREIMREGLVQQGEALKQARLQLPATAQTRADDRPAASAPCCADAGSPDGHSRYRVKFWRSAITADRMSIEVVADSRADARARVLAWGRGQAELSPAEELTETLEREELQDSSFDGLLDPDDHGAVTLIGPGAP